MKEPGVSEKSKAEYIQEINRYLDNGDRLAALSAVRHALHFYPDDPVFMSYDGYLVAVAERKISEGIRTCRAAIQRLRDSRSSDTMLLLPFMYLNLGRVYMRNGKRMEAMDAFQEGLKYDSMNAELLKEMKVFGVRKKKAISFLSRDNPINVFFGKRQRGRKGKK